MLRKLISLILLCIITLLAGEVALRFIPSSIQYPLRIQFSNEDGIGVVHAKNISVINRRACSNKVLYSTNEWGMHDMERTLEKKQGVIRVAMLGDSMLDAEQVSDADVINRLLDERFKGKAEFLNFGMNAVGTMQESLLYENKVRAFKPDIVLLMFYTENDIANNSVSLETTIFNGEPFLTYRDTEGKPYSVINFTASKKIRQFLQRNLALYRLAREVYSGIHYKKSSPETNPFIPPGFTDIPDTATLSELRQGRGANIRNEVFITSPDAEWEKAWDSTNKELRRLRAMVEKDGARLLVAIVPSIMEFDPRTKEAITDAVFTRITNGRPIDIDYPRTRAIGLLMQEGFDYFDLYVPMRKYAEEHGIGFPYFSFDCDSHWSALGHEVAYEILAPVLQSYIASSSVPNMLAN